MDKYMKPRILNNNEHSVANRAISILKSRLMGIGHYFVGEKGKMLIMVNEKNYNIFKQLGVTEKELTDDFYLARPF